MEARLQIEDRSTVLDGDDPSSGEAPTVSDAINFVEDRRLWITRAQEVGVQGVHHAARLLDGAGRCDKGLPCDLPTEDALTVLIGRDATEQVHLDRFEVEESYQGIHVVLHDDMLAPRTRFGTAPYARRMPGEFPPIDAELAGVIAATRGFMPDDEGAALRRWGIEASTRVPGAPIIEVGSYCGRSTLWLADAARVAGGHVVTVDHHRGSEEIQAGWEHHDPSVVDPRTGRMDTLPHLRRTLETAGVEDIVTVVVGRSAVVGRLLSHRAAMVFIDGGHGDDEARIDAEIWIPFVASGGLLAIHDVHPDPADGGRPPYERIYRPALDSGDFTEIDAVGSLRVLARDG
jgi:predicted O-methyltransferase YrrM